MAKPLNLIMGSIPMTTAAQGVVRGIPAALPASFYRTTRRVPANQVAFTKRDGARAAARLVQYGAPSVNVAHGPSSEGAGILIHSFEHFRHPLPVLMNLRSGDDNLQAAAQDDIDNKTADFMERYNTLRVAAIGSVIANGKIWFDGNGEFLPTSSGAVTTIDYAIPANNLNQLNGIIGASWATASTDIIGDINAIKKVALQTTGYPIVHAFYGENIPAYIAKNDTIKYYLQGVPQLAQQIYTTGQIPAGFMGLQWHSVYEAFTVSAAGTLTETHGGDFVAFTPEPNTGWYDFVEGGYLVPSTIEVQTSVEGAMRNLRPVSGKFAYASIAHDPVSVVGYAGDTFLPLLKNPNVLFIADVTP